ncbi:hypothetical protein FSARC_9116 [Fusarium sarcochroum]|uniref:Uncharacterized protein n=1 Tax=Fusarium sarcochroum TaxID=1208366 RepID=A0A8H4TRI7_9HYPO|nr:hypothetical protein FSARC_9116 [Fusarium sarcochroum]
MSDSARINFLWSLMESHPPTQPVDFEVRGLGGTTTAFDLTANRCESKPAPKSVKERIVELNVENGRLHHEATYYSNLANRVLRNLFPILQSPVSKLRSVLTSAEHLAGSSLVVESGQYSEISSSPLPTRKAEEGVALAQNSAMPQIKKPSPNGDRAPLPQAKNIWNRNPIAREHMLYGVVVSLTRENGNMRQSIELNKNLAHVVLVQLMREVRQVTRDIQGAITEANMMIEYVNDMWRQDIHSLPIAMRRTHVRLAAANSRSSDGKLSATCRIRSLLLSEAKAPTYREHLSVIVLSMVDSLGSHTALADNKTSLNRARDSHTRL